MKPILKGKTRILRPAEVREIINAISKPEYKDKFEALLYTGCRYTELRWLYKHQKHFKDSSIHIPKFKPKSLYSERYIRLNPNGARAVQYFLRSDKNLPADYVTWIENLNRWAITAGIDPEGITTKTTRKTWESWLVTKYPNQLPYVFLSQGHTEMTALKFYLMIPFTEEDKKQMEYYTGGWI